MGRGTGFWVRRCRSGVAYTTTVCVTLGKCLVALCFRSLTCKAGISSLVLAARVPGAPPTAATKECFLPVVSSHTDRHPLLSREGWEEWAGLRNRAQAGICSDPEASPRARVVRRDPPDGSRVRVMRLLLAPKQSDAPFGPSDTNSASHQTSVLYQGSHYLETSRDTVPHFLGGYWMS